MVLIWICLMLQFPMDVQDGALLSKYLKKTHKTVKGHYGKEIKNFKRLKHSAGELYRMNFDTGEEAYVFIGEIASCKLGGCQAFVENDNGLSSEFFDLLVMMDEKRTILSVQILDYFSDYGYEVTSKRYLKKYRGKNVCDFKKNIDGIDAISGATISAFALEAAISLLCNENEAK